MTLSDSAAPRLTNEQYNNLLIHTTDRATGNYKLIEADDGTEHLAIFVNLYRPGNTRLLLQMSVNTGPLTDVILQQLMIYAGLSVIALLAGFFLYLPALRKTLVPLSNMGESAEIIDAGNLDIRFPINQGQTEIDKLAHSFNGMLERLEISFHNEREAKEQMRRFAADASHELRTPLTSIHGFLRSYCVALRTTKNSYTIHCEACMANRNGSISWWRICCCSLGWTAPLN